DLRRALMLWAMHGQCGSWLACESGGSVKDSVADTSPSRASPPHRDLCWALILWAMHGQCGWLACESGGSVED
ncbi:hypothetical protein, partial [Pseudomonas fluorescens]|uniref:hypothetical protein n=1 Tax=Pseudomonas fluorescens TaxID=294 RepID=UPI001F313EBE